MSLQIFAEAVANNGIPVPCLPIFYLPPGTNGTNSDGETVAEPELTFIDIIRVGGSAVFVIPLICVVEHIAVCKSFGNYSPINVSLSVKSVAWKVLTTVSSTLISYIVSNLGQLIQNSPFRAMINPAGGQEIYTHSSVI